MTIERFKRIVLGSNLTGTDNGDDTITIDAAGGGTGWDAIVTKTANQVVNNSTTVVNDNELFFTVVAEGVYEFEIALIFACAVGGTASDLKIGLGEDNTARGAATAFGNRGATDATANLTFLVEQDSATVWGVAVDKRVAIAHGYYKASGSGGTFRLVWAQASAVMFDLTVYAGSQLRYRLLG